MLEDLGPNSFKAGNQLVVIEPPDLYQIHWNGVVESWELLAMAKELKRRIADWPYAFAIIHHEKLLKFTPEARTAWGQVASWFPLRGTARVVGTYSNQAVGQLMMRAVELRNGLDNPSNSFKTEEEARAWLEERRHVVKASM